MGRSIVWNYGAAGQEAGIFRISSGVWEWFARVKNHLPAWGSLPVSAPLMRKKIARSKTRKGVSKRFKITGTGKILRRKQGRRHLAECKNRKRKRNLRKVGLVAAVDVHRLMECMPYSH